MPSRSLIGTPSINSIASTREVHRFGKSQRNVDGAVVGELEPAALDRAAFAREVELALDRALEFAGHRERPVDGEIRDAGAR